ncbi:MAG: nitroreductase [Candidatus Scalindua sp.]|jgi:nitroreductase|nr:nitroreductase [Candidatus Scalindua sp.]MBT5306623.1 nitroreductase [Candidatus Scalindua sp.]MBT6230114.1 nitroreductase [Candidatus Scalindua sp.]MBT6561436.1 nitroreductase [Candidatus Scalindua sp.]MBT7212644.1 nitroreductase [Candidatus Scalindua sp.]
MDFYETINLRRSIRAYKKDPVENDKLDRILNAARLAPTAANRQPFSLIVVKNEQVKYKLKDAYSQEWFYTAPVIICACASPGTAWKRNDGKAYVDVDVAIAMDHLILAASAEGLGTCWIAAFKPEVVRDALNIPDNLEPLILTPLGYPEVIPEPTFRKPLEEMVKEI